MSPTTRWLRRGALALFAFAVLDYLVLPQIAGTHKALDHLLSSIRWWWVATGLVLEAMSLVSYSLLTRTVFPNHRPPFGWLIRTDLTSLGVSHLLPGGTATATALRYRLLRAGGILAEDAAVGMAVQGVGSNLVLAAIAWLALVGAVPFVGLHSLYTTAAVLGAVVILAVAAILFFRSGRSLPAPNILRRLIGHLPRKVRPRIEAAFRAAATQVRQLLADRRSLLDSAIWAAASWLLDAFSLWVFLAAYGDRINPDGLLVAYGIANLVAIVPISPGGLGIIEAVLIPSLVGFGTPRSIAILGVISWRLFNFWAPIPIGGVCYLSMRTEHWWRRKPAQGVGTASGVEP